MVRIKWLVYTVLVGLIPVLARLVVYALSPSAPRGFMWNAADISAFGLVLNISNINALESGSVGPRVRTATNGLSLMHIAFFGLLFAVSFLQELHPGMVDASRLNFIAAILAVTSFSLSYAVFAQLAHDARGGEA